MDKLQRLTEHVWVLPFDETTDRPVIGVIASDGQSVLYDAGCGPKTANLLMSELKANNLPKPDKIILSHFHWDHSFRAGYIDGELISSRFTAEKMRQMASMKPKSVGDFISDDLMPEFCREHINMEYSDASEIKLRVPDTIIGDRYTVKVGSVTVDIKQITSPHCNGQIVRYVREDKVLFLADSFSAEIIGHDFIDNREKRRQFNRDLREFPFEHIVLGHFDCMNYRDFWQLAEERLEERESLGI